MLANIQRDEKEAAAFYEAEDSLPEALVGNTDFGEATGAGGTPFSKAGLRYRTSPLYQIGGPRSMQLAAKLVF